MYRVILVDDEIWTLQGIKESFNWSKYNMEVIGTYTFATEALKEILEKKPDIVFTDIRMPVISGLEIISKIRENELNTEVIIVSGFAQFEYAKEAIKKGAFDFILKPLDMEENDSLLERLKVKLDSKSQEKNKKLFEMVMDDPEDLKPNDYGLPDHYPNYQVAIWVGDGEDKLKAYLDSLEDMEYVNIAMHNKQYFIMNTKGDISSLIIEQNFSAVIGLSSVCGSALNIPKMISQSGMAALGNFISGKVKTYLYRPMHTSKITPLIVRITKLLDEGQLTEYNNLIGQIPVRYKENDYTVEELCFAWNRIVMHIELLYPERLAKSELGILEWYQLEAEYGDIDSMFQELLRETSYIYGTSTIDAEMSEKEDSTNFSKILRYLNQHYNEQIKLKDISQMYYINKNYACFLFKRNTGMSYSDYLNKIRMEQAKKLLVSTEYTIFEISEMVGYMDYSYFSKAFKKKYNVTPTQYRKTPT